MTVAAQSDDYGTVTPYFTVDDPDALMAFATFAKHCNFTHAARELFITQPALHAKVKRLSQGLGVVLYTRHGRRLELTPAGRLLADHARQLSFIRRGHHRHVWQRGQHTNVVGTGMGRPVGTDQTGAVYAKPDRQVLDRHIVDYLVVTTL